MSSRPTPAVISIETTTHGRVLVVRTDGAAAAGLIVAFHGYGQSADDLLSEIEKIPGISGWDVASVQGLHRFYTRGDAAVVANWMTRQDREEAIADNIAYVDRVVEQLTEIRPPAVLVFAGFSQGVAMAYRAALRGRRRPDGVIALAGDIPPDVKDSAAGREWPAVLIGVGDAETWYSPDKVESDRAFLDARGVPHRIVRFRGGHEWTEEFGVEVRKFLDYRQS
jgi:predicted esterase